MACEEMAGGEGAPSSAEHFDLIIIGAGISGIAGAYYFKKRHPTKTLLILEARDGVGGTWDFFKYPGVRCDSPIYTFGFSFKPWQGDRKFPEARDIKKYIESTMREFDIARHVRYGMRVAKAEIDTARDSRWRLETEDGARFTSSFVFMCGGYYQYDSGHSPELPGKASFLRSSVSIDEAAQQSDTADGDGVPEEEEDSPSSRGAKNIIVHAQSWDTSLDYRDKNVVIVGSGATAFTMVPAMVRSGARQVVMVQRSPTYVAMQTNAKDKWVGILPYPMVRRMHMNSQRTLYNMCRWFPQLSRWHLLRSVLKSLPNDATELNCSQKKKRKVSRKKKKDRSPQTVLDDHFSPTYAPFDQRVCMLPDGDYFNAMHEVGVLSGEGERTEFRRAVIVTGHIDRFTKEGLRMKPGAKLSSPLVSRDGTTLIDNIDDSESRLLEIQCEVAVLATGFNLQKNYPMSSIQVRVNGAEYRAPDHFVYKSCMLSDVPNFFFCVGYINNSWTIKSELVAEYVCDMIHYMEGAGVDTFSPQLPEGMSERELGSVLPLKSGYAERHRGTWPKVLPQTSGSPWVAPHDYKLDMKMLSKVGDRDDSVFVRFGRCDGRKGAEVKSGLGAGAESSRYALSPE